MEKILYGTTKLANYGCALYSFQFQGKKIKLFLEKIGHLICQALYSLPICHRELGPGTEYAPLLVSPPFHLSAVFKG